MTQMTQEKDYLGEQLHLAERAREEMYFRQLDQTLLAQMRQQKHAEAEVVTQAEPLFTSILVPVDFSAYSTAALSLQRHLSISHFISIGYSIFMSSVLTVFVAVTP